MTTFDTYLEDKSTYQFALEPLVLQSEYFNVSILKSIEALKDKIDIKQVLTVSAQQVSYSQFSHYFKTQRKSNDEEKKKFVENYFSHCGFGNISMRNVSNKGGHAELISDHYAYAWQKYYGNRKANDPGIGYFVCGFLCGAVEAIFDVPCGTFDGKQSMDLARGEEKSRFEIFRGLRRKLNGSPRLGKEQEEDDTTSDLSGVNDMQVIDAIKSLNLIGDNNESGLIEAFDATWTRHYANYHALVMIKLLMQAEKKLGKGGIAHIKKIFTEAAEENAYFLLGKLLNSSFWKENITSIIASDKNSAWHACLDIMTGFGYGKWELVEGSSTEYKINVINNPETNAFLKLVGNTKAPLGYYMGGFLRGMAHFIEKNPAPKQVDLEFVEQMKASKGEVSYKEEQSRMMGAERDLIMVLVH